MSFFRRLKKQTLPIGLKQETVISCIVRVECFVKLTCTAATWRPLEVAAITTSAHKKNKIVVTISLHHCQQVFVFFIWLISATLNSDNTNNNMHQQEANISLSLQEKQSWITSQA